MERPHSQSEYLKEIAETRERITQFALTHNNDLNHPDIQDEFRRLDFLVIDYMYTFDEKGKQLKRRP